MSCSLALAGPTTKTSLAPVKRLGDVVVVLLVFFRFARAHFAAFDVQVFVRICGENESVFRPLLG